MISRNDCYPHSSRGRPNLWACLAPADYDQQRNETRRYASKYYVDSKQQLNRNGWA
jgi:hypothetical protein